MNEQNNQFGQGQANNAGQNTDQTDARSQQQQGQSFETDVQSRQADQGSNSFASQIREHMEVIGADGAHVGTVDEVEGDKIKLTKSDSGMGAHSGHHHYLPLSQVSGVHGNQVRMMANGANEYGMETES